MSDEYYSHRTLELYNSIRSVLVIPFGVAIIGALFCGAVVASLLWFWLPFEIWFPITLIVTALAGLVSWVAMLFFWWYHREDGILKVLSRLQVSKYLALQPLVWEGKRKTDGGQITDRNTTPLTRYQWIAVAQHILRGGRITYRALNSIMSDKQVDELKVWLQDPKREYAIERVPGVPQQGIEMTSAGIKEMERIANELPAYPTPDINDPNGWQRLPTRTRTRE